LALDGVPEIWRFLASSVKLEMEVLCCTRSGEYPEGSEYQSLPSLIQDDS